MKKKKALPSNDSKPENEEVKKLKAEIKKLKSDQAKWNFDTSQLAADRLNLMLLIYILAKKEDGLARDYVRGMITIPRFKKDFEHVKKVHKGVNRLSKFMEKIK